MQRALTPLVLCLAACSAPSSMPSEWSAFRGGVLHHGATPITEPELVWEFDTGGVVESPPTVVDGSLYCGTFNNCLYALDAASGQELWRFLVGGLVRASPSVVDGTVFFGADDNRFYAIDALTGQKRWSVTLGDGGEQSSPTILDGVRYFGGFDHEVDVASGEVLWTTTTGGAILSSPAVADGLVAIGSQGGSTPLVWVRHFGCDAALQTLLELGATE
ncbi:MAG: PQQ-binding-like beta-propeller repeat protein [Planctomycetota bacterium]|nr:PQQ-binding-like beta-propeller repeat protein [Planctomycetota bacterium]